MNDSKALYSMIVTCKTCQKRYLIEKEDVGPQGRQVRCISCGYSWQQLPVEENISVIPPKPTTFDPGYTAGIPRPKRISWILSIGALVTLSACLYILRAPLVSQWPDAEKIFAALKIPVYSPYKDLALENITPLQIDQINGLAYALKGELVNEASEIRSVPALQIVVQGDCAYAGPIARFHKFLRNLKAKLLNQPSKLDALCVLETWNYHLSQTRIFPKERLSFETQPRPVVPGASDISIDF